MGKIEDLIVRLNDCFGLIREHHESQLESQAILYAAFLTDVQEGKIDVQNSTVSEMIEMVNEFCTLISTDLA